MNFWVLSKLILLHPLSEHAANNLLRLWYCQQVISECLINDIIGAQHVEENLAKPFPKQAGFCLTFENRYVKISATSATEHNDVALAGVVQLVERLLAKEKVVSSSLIARSSRLIAEVISLIFRRRGQVVRQESAKLSSWVQFPSSPLFII